MQQQSLLEVYFLKSSCNSSSIRSLLFFNFSGFNNYKARKRLSDLYNSEKNRIEFKLAPKDLMMMNNYRVLHGRTKFDPSEGKRFLQGCYIDFDSTEGK